MDGMIEEIVRRYFEGAVAILRSQDLMRLPDPNMPAEMRDPTKRVTDDWIPWKDIPSTVTDSDLDSLENEFHIEYPTIYRALLKYKHFYDLPGVVRFFCHPIRTWHQELRQYYRGVWYPKQISALGLIPFGDETFMDAGPVCFDIRDGLMNGDCPIVFWDHEFVGTDREVRPLFSSAIGMFKCLSFSVEQDVNFIYHDGDDNPDLLPLKQRLLAEFLALDSEGAGTKAREYWTTWGVKP